jgi:hypothetical protein
MPKSPKVSFESIRKKIIIKDNIEMKSNILFLIVVLYSFLTLLLLVYNKPSFICRDSYNEYEKQKISYIKLFMCYILIQIPLFFYLIISC